MVLQTMGSGEAFSRGGFELRQSMNCSTYPAGSDETPSFPRSCLGPSQARQAPRPRLPVRPPGLIPRLALGSQYPRGTFL